jgi:polysaccharide chain length determinant protein (PEP-CTERM system associated)
MDREPESGKDVRQYLALLRWHKGQILVVAAAFAAIAVAVAIGLPPVYRSAATILVQEQEIPTDLVRSTVTSFADERIQVISQQVMTRAVLLELADKHDLYPKLRRRAKNEEIVERMRQDIQLSTVDASVSDRSSGRRVNATIAFRISYDAPDADRAQRVVNDLVALYLDENIKARQQSVAQTTAFLAEEAERIANQIKEIESNLAKFKRRYAGRLPESGAVNMQLADRIESELLRVEREISMLQDRKIYLEAQIPLVKPSVAATPNASSEQVLTSDERLHALQTQYANAATKYGPDHPDIRRLKREIAALQGEAEAPSRKPDGKDGSPPKRIERNATGDTSQRADNPAYLALTSQLQSTTRELTHLSALREDLRAKQRDYDARLLQIPEIEREYRDLTRDYDNAQTRYREVKAKQMQAEVAVELEKDRKGERFTLGEQANRPEKPIRPNRPGIILVGLAASLGSGLGLAWLRELLDRSIKGPWQLARAAASVPILTPIPYIETEGERRRHRRRAWLVGVLVGLAAVAFLFGMHLFLRPLPELWEALARRFW